MPVNTSEEMTSSESVTPDVIMAKAVGISWGRQVSRSWQVSSTEELGTLLDFQGH